MRKGSQDILHVRKQSSEFRQKKSQFHNYRERHNPKLPKILQQSGLKYS